jgi:uncharacterized protein YjdB
VTPLFSSLRLSWTLTLALLATACGSDLQPESVAFVRVSAPKTEIEVGETVQLTATAHDQQGDPLEGREFEWSSGIGSVASVSPSGLVTALKKGQSEIRATTETVTGALIITVDPARVD